MVTQLVYQAQISYLYTFIYLCYKLHGLLLDEASFLLAGAAVDSRIVEA